MPRIGPGFLHCGRASARVGRHHGGVNNYEAQHQKPYDPYSARATGADDRLWAIVAHLSAPIAAVVSAGWLTIVGPLIVWLAKKDTSPFVRNASAGAFNFTVSMWLTSLIGWILTITVVLAIIGIPLIIIGSLGAIILGIVGAIKSSSGESYTYPWQLRILK